MVNHHWRFNIVYLFNHDNPYRPAGIRAWIPYEPFRLLPKPGVGATEEVEWQRRSTWKDCHLQMFCWLALDQFGHSHARLLEHDGTCLCRYTCIISNVVPWSSTTAATCSHTRTGFKAVIVWSNPRVELLIFHRGNYQVRDKNRRPANHGWLPQAMPPAPADPYKSPSTMPDHPPGCLGSALHASRSTWSAPEPTLAYLNTDVASSQNYRYTL